MMAYDLRLPHVESYRVCYTMGLATTCAIRVAYDARAAVSDMLRDVFSNQLSHTIGA